MRLRKWLTPLIFVFVTLFIFNACGVIQEKPTGLEDSENEQLKENTTVNYAIETEDEEMIEDDEKDVESESDSNKSIEKNNSDEQTSSNDQEQTDSTNSEVNKNDKPNQSDQSAAKKKESTSKDKSEQKESSSSKKSNKSSDDASKAKEKKSATTEKEKKEEKQDNSTEKDKQNPPPKESKDTIVLSIVVSSDEVILPPTQVEINDGDSVLKVLSEMTKERGIQRSITSAGYVSSINGLAEKDRGSGSGWMYRVNGVFPNIGAGGFTLQDGDVVEWLYTLDLGKDIGAH